MLGLAGVYATALLVLAYMPQGTVPVDLWTGVGDKIPHATAFALLTLLLLEGFAAQRARRWVLLCATLVLGFGGLIELTQPFFHRTCSRYDWFADVAGFLMASIAWAVARAMLRRRSATVADREVVGMAGQESEVCPKETESRVIP